MLEPKFCSQQTILIETPRGSFVKRNEHGQIDYVSPIPCPFHYGCLPELNGGDGDPMDALWFGYTPHDTHITGIVIGVVRFRDHGSVDDKWILTDGRALTRVELWGLQHFFRGYATLKNLLELVTSRAMNSQLVTIELWHKS